MTDLWILYKQTVMEKNGPKLKSWADEHSLISELFIIENFSIVNDQIYYNEKLITEFPKLVLIRGNQRHFYAV